MADVPFRVKAIHEYSSPHSDDLSFPLGQIITVTEEEDADWYVGEYQDSSGVKKDGLFPKNFVEKFEPQAPPRPTRTKAPKEPLPVVEPDEAPRELEDPSLSRSSRAVQPEPQIETQSTAKPSAPVEQTKAIPSKPVTSTSRAPPPTADKPSTSSFKDRIAAFNKPAAAPLAPVKPSSASTGFIKKPFVPPPPSRNAYVPPPKVDTVQKVYRRDEDPEILERQQQDQEEAERAGLAGPAEEAPEEGEAPKATSLKDRIALLQKQQQEAAARRADVAQRDTAPRVTKPRQEPIAEREHDADDEQVDEPSAPPTRVSTDLARDVSKPTINRRISREPRASTDDLKESDGNEADQSGAGEITEDAADESTEVEDEGGKAPQMPAHPPSNTRELADPIGAESELDDEEEEEETEEQKEARRKAELRERMAKMSGGMGMAGMFGPPAGGMGLPPPKKRTTGDSATSPPPAQRAPMIPVPGMGAPPLPNSRAEISKEEEEESSTPALAARHPDDIADLEDLEPQPTQLPIADSTLTLDVPVLRSCRSSCRSAKPCHVSTRSSAVF